MNDTKISRFPFSELLVGDIFTFPQEDFEEHQYNPDLKFIKVSHAEIEILGKFARYTLKAELLHSTNVHLINPYE